MRLTIQHTGYDAQNRPLFTLSNGETVTNPVPLPDPAEIIMAGYENFTFPQNLRWYLEEYLNLPDGPSQKRAEATTAALENWGTSVFDALFDRNTYDWYDKIRKDHQLEALQVRVISGSPAILAWPWEALCDNRQPGGRTGYFLAPHCCLERTPDPDFTASDPPGETDCLRMLLVISRPFGEWDVGYHAVARAVVDYVRDEGLPVKIDVLRPPTFEHLQETLAQAKTAGTPYHIVHFDGHGGYGAPPQVTGHPRDGKFQGAEGCLAFETNPEAGQDVQPNLVGARKLGAVLFECGVSMVALNACQSAMIDENAESAYASVAASLLHAGIRSVTAMGYSLYVSGAKHFVPAYYKQLFRDGTPAGAMRAGRMAMFMHPERISNSSSGTTPLQDWIVPELYQKLPAGARVLPRTLQDYCEPEALQIEPPDALRQDRNLFIGRGQAILELERLMQRKRAAGILIRGMAGAGKTTLAKGFLAWLRDTGGLRNEDGSPCPVFWFDFRDISSGSYIVEYLANQLLEGGPSPRYADNLRRLVSHLKRRRAFIVWDNFESASGAPGTEANLSDSERQHLKDFLEELRGGRTKVLITSRTEERWLTGGTDRICAHMKRDLDGLRDEELWAYCGEIAEELGITLNKKDKDLAGLLDKLDGNPLAIRSILLRLKGTRAAALSDQLDRAFNGAEGDESTKRIYAAFDVLMHGADADMAPVLQALGLHEHFADADDMENILSMKDEVEPNTPERKMLSDTISRCFALLESAGLCTHIGENIYRVHPALRGFLAERYAPTEDVKRCFAVYMDYVENQYHNDVEARRGFFFFHEANVRHAQAVAEDLGMQEEELSLTIGMAVNADDRGAFGQAEALYLHLADKSQRFGRPKEEARAYIQLSVLASQRGDQETAKQWAQRAADVWKNAENLSADALFTMGANEFTQGHYIAAMEYLKQAAALWERDGDPGIVSIYGALGVIASMLGDDAEEQKWNSKHWKAAKERGDISSMADASRRLANYAEEHGDIKKAEDQYRQAIHPIPHVQPLNSIPIIDLTDEERAMTDDQKAAAARKLILSSLYGLNKQSVSSNVNSAVSLLQARSGQYAAETSSRIAMLRVGLWMDTITIVLILVLTFGLLYTRMVHPLQKFAHLIPENQLLDEYRGFHEVRLVAAAYNDVLQRRDALDAILRSAAETDALTNLPNRYRFEQYLLEAEDRGHSVAVMLFDVDYLKRTNDTLGHLAGDKLIRSAADCISESFGENCFRFGGDEFAAIVPDCTQENLRQMVSHFEALESQQHISISMGIAFAADIGSTTYKQLLDEADRNMYAQKNKTHRRD